MMNFSKMINILSKMKNFIKKNQKEFLEMKILIFTKFQEIGKKLKNIEFFLIILQIKLKFFSEITITFV